MLDPGKTGRLFPDFFLALQCETQKSLSLPIARLALPVLWFGDQAASLSRLKAHFAKSFLNAKKGICDGFSRVVMIVIAKKQTVRKGANIAEGERKRDENMAKAF